MREEEKEGGKERRWKEDKRQVGLETEKAASGSLVNKYVGRGCSSGNSVYLTCAKSWVLYLACLKRGHDDICSNWTIHKFLQEVQQVKVISGYMTSLGPV